MNYRNKAAWPLPILYLQMKTSSTRPQLPHHHRLSKTRLPKLRDNAPCLWTNVGFCRYPRRRNMGRPRCPSYKVLSTFPSSSPSPLVIPSHPLPALCHACTWFQSHKSPHSNSFAASPSRSRSPLASLEMRKRFLSPSKGYDELLSPTLEEPPKKKTIHLSPSRQSIESGSLTKYLPKFSPRDVLKFSPRRQGFKNLDEKKGLFRS